MKIIFLTNSYTRTAVPYIKKLIEAKKELVAIVLLKTIKLGNRDIRGFFNRIKKYGLRHIFIRIRQTLNLQFKYIIFSMLRKMKVVTSNNYHCVEELQLNHPLNSFVTEDVNCQASVNILKQLKPDIIFVCTLSQIVRNDVLQIPRYGCINIHAGLLPRYRGPASNFWVLFNGEEKTGVTFHYMTEGIDDGDIILQKELRILPDDTENTLDIRLAQLGSESICEVVKQVENGTVKRRPQSKQQASYFRQPQSEHRKLLVKMRKKSLQGNETSLR